MAGELQYVIAGRIPWSGVWLNRHYLARELARQERVVFVLDPRPANPFRRRTLPAGRWKGGGAPSVPPGVRTVRIAEPPLQRVGAMRRLGEALSVRRIRRRLTRDAEVVLVYFPRARLLPPGALEERLSVYFCPDDFRFLPDDSLDREFCAWEELALARSDLAIGISRRICESLEARHPRVRLVENGYDPELFRPGAGPIPEEVAELPPPRVGYVGTVRTPLIDLGLVAEAATARPEYGFFLIGWYDAGDPGIERLRRLGNVRILGPRPREDLARYLGAMDVLTCPYPKCRITEAGFPLKAYEALAVGRPLVASHSPVLDAFRPHLRSTGSPEEFLASLDEVLADPPKGGEEIAAGFTWSKRAEEFRQHVVRALSSRPSA